MRILVALVALALAAVGVQKLAEATMTRHSRTHPMSKLEVVVHADTKRYSPYTLEEMTSSLILTCRLEVKADTFGEVEELPDDHFRFTIQPALDEADQRQLHGCLEDARIDRLQLGVVSMDERGPTLGS